MGAWLLSEPESLPLDESEKRRLIDEIRGEQRRGIASLVERRSGEKRLSFCVVSCSSLALDGLVFVVFLRVDASRRLQQSKLLGVIRSDISELALAAHRRLSLEGPSVFVVCLKTTAGDACRSRLGFPGKRVVGGGLALCLGRTSLDGCSSGRGRLHRRKNSLGIRRRQGWTSTHLG